MIIFDLDGTLADCEHRRHYVDPSCDDDACFVFDEVDSHGVPIAGKENKGKWHRSDGIIWKPDWKSFFEACDKDELIKPVAEAFCRYSQSHRIDIWSGRCASVRKKTVKWLGDNYLVPNELKMRPIGDCTPDDQLKEKWLHEALENGRKIEAVFDDRPKVVEMWRRNGIFVFDCNQTGKVF